VKGIALRACAPEKGRAEFLLMGIIIKTGRGRETGRNFRMMNGRGFRFRRGEKQPVGASLLAMDVWAPRIVRLSRVIVDVFASRLVPTESDAWGHDYFRAGQSITLNL
jgi:hypothetical protein